MALHRTARKTARNVRSDELTIVAVGPPAGIAHSDGSFDGTAGTRQGEPEPVFCHEAAANVPGQKTSVRNSCGPVPQGDHSRAELMAIHELELDALAQTGEQRRPASGKDRLDKELVLVD